MSPGGKELSFPSACPSIHEQLREVAEKLEIASQGRLVNQPSDYEIEFYLHENKQAPVLVYLRLMTIKDPRFTYRKAVSSSSLAPETAALINSYVLDYASLKGRSLIESATMACC